MSDSWQRTDQISSGTNDGDGMKPKAIYVRMYQVGFGDCILLSFDYGHGHPERHMLIDFGTTSRPRGAPSPTTIAKSIAKRTGGSLDVLAISHRHRDHLSGLAVDASAAILDQLSPKLIVLPWTEDPAAPADAEEPDVGLRAAFTSARQFAAAIQDKAPSQGPGSRSELVRAARAEVANAEAVEWLGTAAAKAQAEYLHAGMKSRIGEFIPGVEVEVLGPPKPSQWPEVRNQRAEDPEYWMLGAKMLEHFYTADPGHRLYGSTGSELPLPTDFRRADPPPGPNRWILARLRRQEMAAMTTIVRWLDDALNNTSLVLLIKGADKTLLFPGDAQIENWGWALDEMGRRPSLRKALGDIDLLKVGHHGSRNGTPRTLYNLWAERPNARRPPTVLLSTRHGVHGKTEATAVPRATLLRALTQVGDVYSTDGLQGEFIEAIASSRTAGFRVDNATPVSSVADVIAVPREEADDDGEV